MRNPNGAGSVYKLSGARRRPWAARKTTGWQPNGQPVYMFVGYYETRKEAMEALARYNANPYDKKATFLEVLNLWKDAELEDLSVATQRAFNMAAARCAPLYKKKIAEIKLNDMQALADKTSESVGKQIKVLLSHVFEYAVRHEIITADRHQLVSFVKPSEDKGKTIERKVFTLDEIQNTTDPYILILLWTGLRVGELLALQPEDIHLEDRYFRVRKSKTAAGVRIVPIAERIVPLFALFPITMNYDQFKYRFKEACPGHLPHDTRHTFISRLADLGVDERITKAIVGHAGSGITESVYTHINIQPMLDAVNRL